MLQTQYIFPSLMNLAKQNKLTSSHIPNPNSAIIPSTIQPPPRSTKRQNPPRMPTQNPLPPQRPRIPLINRLIRSTTIQPPFRFGKTQSSNEPFVSNHAAYEGPGIEGPGFEGAVFGAGEEATTAGAEGGDGGGVVGEGAGLCEGCEVGFVDDTTFCAGEEATVVGCDGG